MRGRQSGNDLTAFVLAIASTTRSRATIEAAVRRRQRFRSEIDRPRSHFLEGQVARTDRPIDAEDDRALDHVAQLAHESLRRAKSVDPIEESALGLIDQRSKWTVRFFIDRPSFTARPAWC
jgi:hypothetical protein